jgi:hypothetical protein
VAPPGHCTSEQSKPWEPWASAEWNTRCPCGISCPKNPQGGGGCWFPRIPLGNSDDFPDFPPIFLMVVSGYQSDRRQTHCHARQPQPWCCVRSLEFLKMEDAFSWVPLLPLTNGRIAHEAGAWPKKWEMGHSLLTSRSMGLQASQLAVAPSPIFFWDQGWECIMRCCRSGWPGYFMLFDAIWLTWLVLWFHQRSLLTALNLGAQSGTRREAPETARWTTWWAVGENFRPKESIFS